MKESCPAPQGVTWTRSKDSRRVKPLLLLAAFADVFGTSVANPPSTPKVIVEAAGRTGELATGPSSPDDLVADLRAAAA